MNIPLPTAVPSTNATLKEETPAQPLSPGTLKTSSGEVSLSTAATEEALLASSNALADVVVSQILTSDASAPHPPSSLNHNLAFLSPETVDLEIQISDLVQLLESDSMTLKTPAEPQKSKAKASTSSSLSRGSTSKGPQSTRSSVVSQAKQSSSPSLQGSSQPLGAKSSSLFLTSTNTTQHVQATHESTAATPEHLQSSSEKEGPHSLASSTHACCSDRRDEILFSTKIHEFYKDSRDSKDQQQERQHQGQQQDPEKEEKKKKLDQKASKTKKSEEISTAALSLASLRYHYETRPIKDEDATESPIFRKKAQSPMALFGETPTSAQNFTPIQTPKIENVFIRFMKLMERILGQAEAEAHELYLRVKERTDNVDTLTLLISKINSEKKDINWSKDDEMKALVDQAAKLGVNVKFEKDYTWTEEEKKLLKENVLMRKENLEKITQLERTDMQRHLQEVSQCHQARSNVLKLLKELMDTFTYNLRP